MQKTRGLPSISILEQGWDHLTEGGDYYGCALHTAVSYVAEGLEPNLAEPVSARACYRLNL